MGSKRFSCVWGVMIFPLFLCENVNYSKLAELIVFSIAYKLSVLGLFLNIFLLSGLFFGKNWMNNIAIVDIMDNWSL